MEVGITVGTDVGIMCEITYCDGDALGAYTSSFVGYAVGRLVG